MEGHCDLSTGLQRQPKFTLDTIDLQITVGWRFRLLRIASTPDVRLQVTVGARLVTLVDFLRQILILFWAVYGVGLDCCSV
jgi:hypothetical protein